MAHQKVYLILLLLLKIGYSLIVTSSLNVCKATSKTGTLYRLQATSAVKWSQLSNKTKEVTSSLFVTLMSSLYSFVRQRSDEVSEVFKPSELM